jgi:hypothetical protein
MVMVDVKGDTWSRWGFTQRTDITLAFKDAVVLIWRQAELVPQVELAHLLVTTLTVSNAPSLHAILGSPAATLVRCQ